MAACLLTVGRGHEQEGNELRGEVDWQRMQSVQHSSLICRAGATNGRTPLSNTPRRWCRAPCLCPFALRTLMCEVAETKLSIWPLLPTKIVAIFGLLLFRRCCRLAGTWPTPSTGSARLERRRCLAWHSNAPTASCISCVMAPISRKAGAMLAAMDDAKGRNQHTTEDGNIMLPPSLDDLGIDKMQSSRWQKKSGNLWWAM